MGVNNFKKLEEMELQKVASINTESIKNGISSNMGSIRFVTNIVELYFPKVVDVILGMMGVGSGSVEKEKNNNSRYPDLG